MGNRSRAKSRTLTHRKDPVPRLKRANGPEATSFESLWFNLAPRFREMYQGFREPYRQHPWVFAAVNAISRNVSGTPWLLREGNKKDPRTLETGPWVELFDRVNPLMDLVGFFSHSIIWYLLSGETMIVKEGKTEQPIRPGEIPFYLWPLNGKLFKPVIDPRTRQLVAWEYVDQETLEKKRLLVHQVIHWKDPDPYNPLRGLGRLEAAMRGARSDWKATQYNESFFDNDAMPGMVVKGPQGQILTADQRHEIKQELNDKHGGFGKSWKAMVLSGGWDVTSLGSNHKDMAFLEQLQWNRDEILAVFGVPKSEVGIEPGQNMITGQGKESGDRKFWTSTLLPIMQSLESALWRQLFRDASQAQVFGEFDRTQIEALKPNLSLSAETAKAFIALGYPVNQVNERLDLGMEKLKNGDVEFVPAGAVPFDEALPEDDGDDFPEDEPMPEDMDLHGEAVDLRKNLETWRRINDRDPSSDERVAIGEAVKNFIRARKPDRDRLWVQNAKRLAPAEGQFRNKTRGYLKKLRDATLKAVARVGFGAPERGAGRAADDIEKALFDLDRWNARLLDATRPIYYGVIGTSTEGVIEELGGNFVFDQTDPRVVNIVRDRAAKLVKVNETLRRQVRAVLEEGASSNASVASIQDSLRTTFNFAASRALTIARTEVASAANEARFMVMHEEGVEEHEWVTARDEAVRDSHAAQDGVVRKIGEPFPNGLLFPNDPSGAPAETINCRCVAAPV